MLFFKQDLIVASLLKQSTVFAIRVAQTVLCYKRDLTIAQIVLCVKRDLTMYSVSKET